MKRFEYTHKDVKHLKKDIFCRSFFAFVILAAAAWQAYYVFDEYLNNTLDMVKIIVAGIVIFSGVVIFFTSLLYIFRNYRILGSIKVTGKCVGSVNVMFSTEKRSFLKLYQLLMSFLTISTFLVLTAGITYSILQVAYFNKVSFYMPMLIVICFSGLNAVYSVKHEIYIQKNVQQQTP